MARVTPYKIITLLSVLLILGGVLFTVQGLSFRMYRVGFVALICGALLQIIMGNLDPKASWLHALRVFLIGLAIFLTIVFVSIYVVPYIYKWL